MSLVCPQTGEVAALSYLTGKTTSVENVTLKLYTNNYVPVNGSVVGSFTEATGYGYAAIALVGANWTITAGNPSSAAYAQQTFTFSGALGNVYGYFLVRASTGDVMWAEKFTDGPYNIVNSGDQIKITLNITLQ